MPKKKGKKLDAKRLEEHIGAYAEKTRGICWTRPSADGIKRKATVQRSSIWIAPIISSSTDEPPLSI